MSGITDLITAMDYGTAPEGDAHVRAWLAAHEGGFGHFINGAFTAPADTFDVLNPATGEVLTQVSQAGAGDVDTAIAAARAAQAEWAAKSGYERAKVLYAIARHVQQHARFLAVLETLDNGKPIRESRDADIPLVARHFYHHAGWAQIRDDEFPDQVPHGVCAAVIPWNFPLLMLAWKVAPALAAGNAVVLKPAEDTPLSALALAQIAVECGLPAGVLNIVTGDGAVGEMLVKHDGVDKVAFTGSTEVGRAIRAATAGSGKHLTLELGGKSPFVVFADADLDAAVEGVVDAIWFNQGQVCCAGSRVLVAEAVAERFETLLRRRMDRLVTGNPMDKNVDMGAIVSPRQRDRIADLIAAGDVCAEDIVQGDAPEGCFYAPTIIRNVAPASLLWEQEIFGPVATLTTFRTPEDAVALANNTRYGLAASVWSENVNLALDIAAKIKAGVIWINGANMFDAAAAFGGYRESGFGREGGREGMAAYLRASANDATGDDTPLSPPSVFAGGPGAGAEIDRTAKFYIGGKQARADSGYVYDVTGPSGTVGLSGLGSRKDIRNAVEAAHKAGGWSRATGHNRAQVLYYLGENLSARQDELAARLVSFGADPVVASAEVAETIQRCFWYAAQADKFDGAVKSTLSDVLTVATHEPVGVVGVVCPTERPLLGMMSMVLPLIAMGNAVVVVPSQTHPLAATDLYQVLDTSDVPAGVVNIVTGPRDELAHALTTHDGVDALWYVGDAAGVEMVERDSTGNLKQVWARRASGIDWSTAQGRDYLTRATQVKTIWIPYGE